VCSNSVASGFVKVVNEKGGIQSGRPANSGSPTSPNTMETNKMQTKITPTYRIGF
jgi:hypothetical protein